MMTTVSEGDGGARSDDYAGASAREVERSRYTSRERRGRKVQIPGGVAQFNLHCGTAGIPPGPSRGLSHQRAPTSANNL